MATTNKQIIAAECVLNNIMEQVDTFAGWKRRGYSIKKGSKALFSTKIWKPTKIKIKSDEGEEGTQKKLILVKASFFGLSQVEKA